MLENILYSYCTRTSKRIIQYSKIYYKELRVQDSNSPTRCSSDGAHIGVKWQPS